MHKKILTIVLLLIQSTMSWGWAVYNHSEVSPSGHTLYFYVNTTSAYATVVFPNSSAGYSENGWYGFTQPQGHLIIQDSVTYNGIAYAVVNIDERAFKWCSEITAVEIPSSIVQIGNNAFFNCPLLDSVILYRVTPPLNFDNAFEYNNSYPNITFYIPCGAYTNYRYMYGLPSGSTPTHVFGGNLQEPQGPDFIVNVLSDDEDMGIVGIIPHNGNNIHCDSTVVIYAESNNHYQFVQWSNGCTSARDTLHLVGDSTITAFFQPRQYPLIVRSSNESIGTVSGGGVYAYLDTAMVTATAIEHHHFVLWKDSIYGDIENGFVYEPQYSGTNTDNPRQWIVDDLMLFTAFFALDTHLIEVTSNDIIRGRVVGGGEYEYGTPCTISAEAYSGYHFSHWSNGATYNPYTFAVLEDTELMAIFEEGTQGIDDVIDINDFVVYIKGKSIYICGIEEQPLSVYSIDGRIIATKHRATEQETIIVPSAGVYFIKVGEYPARKVVVVR